MERIKSDLRQKNIRPLYLFYGDEEYLKSYYIDEIAAALSELYGGCGRAVLTDEDFSMESFLDSVQNLGFGATAQLVVLRNVDIALFSADAKNQFDTAIEELSDGVCVVLLYDDRYLESGDYNVLRRKKERMLSVCNRSSAIEFPFQSDHELANWLIRRAAAADTELPRNVALYILDVCDRRMSGLVGEIEKLSAYAHGRTATKADVDAVCLRDLEANIFDIVRLVINGQCEKALIKIDGCRKNNESAIAITSALGSAFCELAAAKTAFDAKIKSADKVVLDFGIKATKTGFMRDYLSKAPTLDFSRITSAVITLHEVEVTQKQSGDEWELLELAVMELARR